MIYEPNLETWQIGDIVIHDSDAKEPKMLMKVIGRTRDGLIKTRYCDERMKQTVYKNESRYLHKPERFNLDSDWGKLSLPFLHLAQLNWMRVRRWNRRYEIGQKVKTTSADGGFEAVTATQAYMRAWNALIFLNPGGNWSLEHVEAIEEQEQES